THRSSTPSPSTLANTPNPITIQNHGRHPHRHHLTSDPPLSPTSPNQRRHLPPSGWQPQRRAHEDTLPRSNASWPGHWRAGRGGGWSACGPSTGGSATSGPATSGASDCDEATVAATKPGLTSDRVAISGKAVGGETTVSPATGPST